LSKFGIWVNYQMMFSDQVFMCYSFKRIDCAKSESAMSSRWYCSDKVNGQHSDDRSSKFSIAWSTSERGNSWLHFTPGDM